jgi:hypothetical protein
MVLAEFREVISAARPGSRVRLTLEVDVPAEPSTGPVMAIEMEVPGADPTASVGERVAAYVGTNRDARLSPSEWAGTGIGLSHRELDRAIRHGAVAHEIRGEGKGHSARVILGDALLHYVQTCEAVQHGMMRQPSWWNTVRRGAAANVR